MLYALIDYGTSKKSYKILSEEILGEVKVTLPRKMEKNKKIAQKIINEINKYGVQNIVLSRELMKNGDLRLKLQEEKKQIITGKKLGKALTLTILEDISKYTRYPKEKMNVLLLMNEYSMENIELVEQIASNVKELNLISRNYSKYEKTANKIFEMYGTSVNLYDDECTTEFKRANTVINFDFKEEAFYKINICKNSVVVSLNEGIHKIKRGFNGILINDALVAGINEDSKNYRSLAICEANVYRPLRNLKDNERIFRSEKYIIDGYIGKNGKITTEEFEKIGKNFFLTNSKQMINIYRL